MNYLQDQTAPLLILVSLILLGSAAVVTLFWGKLLPRSGDWLVGLFLLFLVGALVFSGNGLMDEATGPRAWLRGWIWPVGETGALALGILQDPLGLVLAALACVLAAVLIAFWIFSAERPRADRFFSAVAFAAAGTVLSWVSLTPWFAFLGLVLSTFGGFVILGANWGDEIESSQSIRFLRARCFGLMVAVFGVCGICGSHGTLTWYRAARDTSAWIGANQVLTFQESAGVVLLLAGLLIQLQPFPFLGWLVSSPDTRGKSPAWSRLSLTQVFPGLATFGILIRLQNHLGFAGCFTFFGWLLLVSTVLAVICGVFQKDWKTAVGIWFSAGASLAAAILCFGDPSSSLCLLLGLSLGAVAFVTGRSAMAFPAASGDSEKSATAAPWPLKTGVVLGVASAAGMIGFVSSNGFLQWIAQSSQDPLRFGAGLLAIVLFGILGWKLAWSAATETACGSQPHRFVVATPLILVFLSLGLLWTGAISGWSLPGSPDRVMLSLLNLLFGAQWSDPNGFSSGGLSTLGDSALPTVLGACIGALAVSIGVAYWAAKRFPLISNEGSETGKKILRFVVSGYGTDVAASFFRAGLGWVSDGLTRWVDRIAWGRWIPLAVSSGIRGAAYGVSAADRFVSEKSRRWLRVFVDPPAKFLQLIQNGDVQWYLIFGLGAGFAILIHFLWNMNGVVFK